MSRVSAEFDLHSADLGERGFHSRVSCTEDYHSARMMQYCGASTWTNVLTSPSDAGVGFFEFSLT